MHVGIKLHLDPDARAASDPFNTELQVRVSSQTAKLVMHEATDGCAVLARGAGYTRQDQAPVNLGSCKLILTAAQRVLRGFKLISEMIYAAFKTPSV